ncbi:MAG: TraA family conjugative transfer protein [Methylicorpusculum sp.]|jgi:conjugal transfer pilus assembly protein TraA|uniref:TraA family conjugative transfer protein n=1 Tax=Methylicorpusculum TaxID=2713642 RepID=UPI0013588109|nr:MULTISPECIES: TraA family conjugative transfer protein [Methylicorpusculum]MCD2452134.1 pili assembly chaperone [Methylicorpusculum oleiharenae]MDP2203409.1 TraA family conjugative transfer protein [Methylicorpusculum sp.]
MKQLKALFANKAVVASTVAAAALLSTDAMAGTGGTEFDDIYTLLVGWTQGTLGKIIALGMFMVGLSAGIINQSIVAVVVGIGGALALYYGPTVISGVVSALV